MLTTHRRTGFVAAVVATVLFAPSAASAAGPGGPGGLLQLAPPNDCVSDLATSSCGTIVGGGLGTAHDVAISPDGKNAYVASENGALSTFTRNPTTGALSFDRCVKDRNSTEACPANSPKAGDLAGAHAVGVSPDGAFVYVAASTGSSDSITVFSRNGTTGALTPAANPDECISEEIGSPCRSAVGLRGVSYLTVTGNSVYAVSSSASTVVRLARNATTGGLSQASATTDCFRGTNSTETACGSSPTPAGQTQGLNGAAQIKVAPDGKNAYVASRMSSALVTFTRNTSTGVLTAPSCKRGNSPNSDCTSAPVGGLNGAQGLAVANGNVYVVSGPGTAPNTGNTLATFTRDANGAVSETQCFKEASSSGELQCTTGNALGLSGADDAQLTPDGAYLYVSASAGDIAEFSRDTGAAGAVTQLPSPDSCIGEHGTTECPSGNRSAKGIAGASSITAAPNGSPNLYATGPTDDAVAAFQIQLPPTCANTTVSTGHDQPKSGDLAPLCSDPNGDSLTFAKVSDPTNGTVTVNPDGTYTYTPNSGFSGNDSFTYKANDGHADSNAATVTIQVASAGTPLVTISDAAITEGDSGTTNMTFTLTLSQAVGTTVGVDYATADGTAQSGQDYTPQTSGHVDFSPNQTTQQITVPIVGDTVHENSETFTVNLTSITTANAALGSHSQGTGTIADDDTSLANIGDVTVGEGAGTADFSVSLSNPSETEITVTYATVDQTATAEDDYTAQSGLTVTFSPGQTTKTISVPIMDDNVTEQTETFGVNLTSVTGGASLGDSTGTATILDNDPPSITVADAATNEGNRGTHPLLFVVSLSAPTSSSVTVNYATSDRTATAGSDYVATSATLSFAPGQTTRTIAVPVKGDTTVEPNERFRLTLSSPSGATLGTPGATGTIVNDDQPKPPNDTTPPVVTLKGVPATITRRSLLKDGIRYRENANERAVYDNTLLASGRGLGISTSRKFNIVLASKSFPFGRGPHKVRLRPSKEDIGTRKKFTVKVRVVVTDAAGNRTRVTRKVHVVP